MSIKAPVKGGESFDPIPPGSHHAICYGVVDLGTQESLRFEPQRKLLINWELPQERIQIERDGETRDLPRAISQIFTLSMHKKAKLRQTLESWRAKPFTDEEAAEFEIDKLVGANCMLTIVHAAGTGQNANRVYANVRGVNPLPKGMPKAELENPPLVFSLDDFSGGRTIVFPENMPEWIQTKITQSAEYQERLRGHTPPAEADDIRYDFERKGSEHADESFENASPVRERPQPGPDGSVALDPDQEEPIF